MTRWIVYGTVGILVGVIFGLAIFGLGGAIAGAVICLIIGCAIAAFLNRINPRNGQFYSQTDVDQFMRIVPFKTAGLPPVSRIG